MEENNEYQSIKHIITNLEKQIKNVEEAQQNQDFNGMKRAIKEHMGRCVQALEARKQVLVDQLDLYAIQQDNTTKNTSSSLNEKLNTCQKIKEAGLASYSINTKVAEIIWQSAQNFVSELETNDIIQVDINLPTDFLDSIPHYGTVATRNRNKLHMREITSNNNSNWNDIPRVQSPAYTEENERLKRDYGKLLFDNEKLLADNTELLNQLQKVYEELQNTPQHSGQDLGPGNVPNVPRQELQERWNMEDEEVVNATQHSMEQEFRKRQDDLNKELSKANETRLALEATIRSLTDEKVLSAQRLARLEGELIEMKRLYASLKQKSEKLRLLERINDFKETEYQKFARGIGCEPAPTFVILKELSNLGEHRYHDLVKLIYHQIAYWNIIEFEDLPVLQAVINGYSNLLTKYSQNVDHLTYIFSGASLLLYMLAKNRGGDLGDIQVEPIDIKAAEKRDETDNRLKLSGSLNSLTIHNTAPLGSTLFAASAPLLFGVSRSSPSIPPSTSPPSVVSPRTSLPLDRSGPAQCSFRPLRSSADFFSQLKTVVGKCFGLLLTSVAARLDPLLDSTILVENFSSYTSAALPSLRPVITLLHKTLTMFEANMVHVSLSQHFFSEIFIRINNTLMNGVLLRQQFCTENFGAYLRTQIEAIQQAVVHDWDTKCVGELVGYFQGINQVAAVLVLSNKNVLSDPKVLQATCPSLNSLQLRQLLSMYTPGEFGKRVPIPIINAIGARAPYSDADRILLDVNVVHPIPIKVLHTAQLEDMLTSAASPQVRLVVEGIMSGKY